MTHGIPGDQELPERDAVSSEPAGPVASGAAPSPEPAGAEHMPGTADSEGWRRLHPVSPLLRGGLVLVVLIGVFIANFRDLFFRMFLAGPEDDPIEGDDVAEFFRMLSNGQTLLIVLGGVLAL
ncbi:MAG: hypothetical protein KA158_04135, partial [Leucobacter sp.]|nr:hypothetical protein [Leucobacter sp.]